MKKVKLDGGYLVEGDCLKVMRKMKAHSIDLVIGSPPYEAKRSYGIDFNKRGEEWVAWMVEVVIESLRVCKGLVAFVVGHGEMKNHKWSAVPALLTADLHRKGVTLFNPAIYRRDGIPGSGGNQWFRADYEWIVCATSAKGGKLPWSDNKACAEPWKYKPGGKMTYRNQDGSRVKVRSTSTSGYKNGDAKTVSRVRQFDTDNAIPGLVLECGSVGGGHLGSKIAHENEAPFPIKIADRFIRSFCPVNGWVLDPFVGSGTTVACAFLLNRRYVGIDVRSSQVALTRRRLAQASRRKGFGLV